MEKGWNNKIVHVIKFRKSKIAEKKPKNSVSTTHHLAGTEINSGPQ